MNNHSHFLMCRPDYFDVHYIINPWMEGNLHTVQGERGKNQWAELYHTMQAYSHVKLIPAEEALPDLVFTANAGLVRDNKCVLAHFRPQERQKEEPFNKKWFEEKGFETIALPKDIYFEGEGDALFQPQDNLLWMGYGFRTDLKATSYLEAHFNTKVTPLELTDARFYHLDTCLCPLHDGYLMYYPKALSTQANQRIETQIPKEKRVIVSDEDALQFACNAVVIPGDKKHVIIMNSASQALKDRLNILNYQVVIQPVDEFLKAGGATKCLVLKLDQEK